MLKVTDITRSQDMILALQEAGLTYAYVDYPCNTRYIISIENWELGYLIVYKTDPNNVAIQDGHVPVGHQDTVQHLVIRGNSRAVSYENPIDLSTAIGC
jgi:hypothetical protein